MCVSADILLVCVKSVMNTRTIKSPEIERFQDFFLYFVGQKSSEKNTAISHKTV